MTNNLTTNRLMKTFFVVLATASVVGCSKFVGPVGPSYPNTGAGFVLAGSVVASAGDGAEALGDADLTASNGSEERATTSNSEGRFRFEGMPGGDWTIVVSKLGYASQTIQVMVDSDLDLQFTLELEAGSTGDAPPVRIRRIK